MTSSEDYSSSETVSTGQTVNFMGMLNFTYKDDGKTDSPSISSHLALYQLLMGGFFGEPTYYIKSGDTVKDSIQSSKSTSYQCLFDEYYDNTLTTNQAFERVANIAFKEDFGRTLDLAIEVRKAGMRKSPLVLLLIGALHAGRPAFTNSHPKLFQEKAKQIIQIPTDAWTLIDVYKKQTGSIHSFPNVLKKVIGSYLTNCKPYQLKKYITKAHIIDMIRICHPKPNNYLTELIKTSDLMITAEEQTWEMLRSMGNTWEQIVNTINIPHMALLRNLRNIVSGSNPEFMTKVIRILHNGVLNGKQYPFRYMTAYEELKKFFEQNELKKNQPTEVRHTNLFGGRNKSHRRGSKRIKETNTYKRIIKEKVRS